MQIQTAKNIFPFTIHIVFAKMKTVKHIGEQYVYFKEIFVGIKENMHLMPTNNGQAKLKLYPAQRLQTEKNLQLHTPPVLQNHALK